MMKPFYGACAIALALALSSSLAGAATMQCQPFQLIQAPSATYTADGAGIATSVAANDVTAMGQAGCVQVGIGNGNLCGELLHADMTSGGAGAVGDQKFTWFVPSTQSYRLTKITARNATATLAAGAAAGGVYTAAAKGGSAVVANSQVYTALTAADDTRNLDLTLVAGLGTLGEYKNAPLYFSLTTPNVAAVFIDLFAYCDLGN
jgi:hypothetical protein